jgi:ribose transport system ATP-binding protein
MTSETSAPLLEVRDISKRFGATLALSDVKFDLRPGEIHALMGENGAGKSTLMKILAGVQPPDSGEILIDGENVTFATPRDAQSAGLAIIHQELNTVPSMTVAENLALGNERLTRWGTLDRAGMVRDARRRLKLIGSDIDPTVELGRLSIGMQQMVEIARAVSENARILVLDEPTASLSRSESIALFNVVRSMKEQGVGLVYISHRMEEVWDLADRVTVMRDGKWVGTREKADISPSDVVRMMVGRDVENLYSRDGREPGDVLLDVRELGDGGAIGPVSFDVRAGEVVCLSGLIGAGRTEVARLIFGADKAKQGEVWLRGSQLALTSPGSAIASGIGMIPESRKEQALFLDLTVMDNIAMSSLGEKSVGGVLQRGRILTAVREQMTRLKVRLNAIGLSAGSLSGGNQQKLVLGRWLLKNSSVLILDEPTRGVDIGAKSEIYAVINDLVKEGLGVLVISSDLPEAIGISDRILVMRNGRIVHELDSRTATEEEVMFYATGTKGAVSGGSNE